MGVGTFPFKGLPQTLGTSRPTYSHATTSKHPHE
jgi:hypothetical protein